MAIYYVLYLNWRWRDIQSSDILFFLMAGDRIPQKPPKNPHAGASF